MWRYVVGFASLACLGACNQLFEIPDVTRSGRVGGRIRGLWDGTDGVALRLQAEGVDKLLTVSTNGEFHFDDLIPVSESYTVTVQNSPVQHTCLVDVAGNGTIENGEDASDVSVACTGPAVSVTISEPTKWSFDPTEETQQISGSLAMQGATFRIDSEKLLSASINGTVVRLGEKTEQLRLPLGSTTVMMQLTANDGLSKTYSLVFDRGNTVLRQAVYGKASNSGTGDRFSYALSSSGNTLAVGAWGEASMATGIDGNQMSEGASASGAVYVFVRNGVAWTQQAYLKASNTGAGDHFGWSVSLDADTLAVGAHQEASVATGINGNQQDNSAANAGAVYVFARNGSIWSQQAYLKGANTGGGDHFGEALSLSGNTLAVGAFREDSVTTGINGNPANEAALDSGAVYVFVRNGTAWSQQAYVKASNTSPGDYFGSAVSLSGSILAVGAPYEDSSSTGIGGDQNNDDALDAGATYVFVRNSNTWTQQKYIKASNSQLNDLFGAGLSLSGETLAVTSAAESSAATGVNGDQANNSAFKAGAVYVFAREGGTWYQQAYLKASNAGMEDLFGISICLDGDTLAIGAAGESSAATGISGNQLDNSAYRAGAAYLFTRSGTNWSQQAYFKASNTKTYHVFGAALSLSGNTLAFGAWGEDSAAAGLDGDQADNSALASGAFYLFY